MRMHAGSAMVYALSFASAMLFVAACSSSTGSQAGHGVVPTGPASVARSSTKSKAATKLSHIVVIIQENRTVDNLFNGFCARPAICANTVTVDPVTGTPLVPESLAAPYSPDHDHDQFVLQYDNGKMDGFSKTPISCNKGQPPSCPYGVFAFVPPTETTIYDQLASVDGVLSDATFQTNSGPSLSAHLYAIAGQSGGYDSDRWAINDGAGNCQQTQQMSGQILMSSAYPGQEGNPVAPCKDFQTIFDLLASAGHTWKYYASSAIGWWAGPENIQHLYNSPNFVMPNKTILKDIKKKQLPDVSFVMPSGGQSDHPGFVNHPSYGPAWVASVVNAIGKSAYWQNTAVVVFWDDWGGWYDHVIPPNSPVNPDPYEYGFRVPLVVASAYANVGTVDHTPRTFVSVLRLIEETFGLPSLGTTDQYEPDGLDSMFNFNQQPITYTAL